MSGIAGRIFGVLVLFVVADFLWFFATLPQPVALDRRTDAVVVLTGGPGRLARGVVALEAKSARRMLVSGVDTTVRPSELAAQTGASPDLYACCIDLGREATNTRSNAKETAAWVRKHHYRSVRVITSSDHMARARLELRAELGPDVDLLPDAVPRSTALISNSAPAVGEPKSKSR